MATGVCSEAEWKALCNLDEPKSRSKTTVFFLFFGTKKEHTLDFQMAASTESNARIRRILLADDSECVRGIIRKSLETQPLLRVCGEAVDGMDAIEKARKLKPDLILLDLAMPRMNGIETASVLRQEFPDIPIVLLTVHENVLENAGVASRATTAGVTAAISKHAGAAAVVECVQGLLKIES